MDIIAEIFGFCALVCGVIAFQMQNPRQSLWLLSAACLCWALNFGVIGQWAGMITSVAVIIRNVCAIKFSERIMKRVTAMCFLICAAIILSLMASWYDLVALAAMFWTSLAVYYRDHPLFFRLSCLAGDSLWLAFGVLIGSFFLSVSSLFLIASVMIGLLRYDILPFAKKYPAPFRSFLNFRNA